MIKISAPVLNMDEFDYSITYYVSGPMAGYTDHNFPLFEKANLMLEDSGIKTLSPHNVEHEGENLRWHDYLRGDLIEMLSFCGGIILLPGWPQSSGAGLELYNAKALGWPVYYFDPETMTLTNMNRSPV